VQRDLFPELNLLSKMFKYGLHKINYNIQHLMASITENNPDSLPTFLPDILFLYSDFGNVSFIINADSVLFSLKRRTESFLTFWFLTMEDNNIQNFNLEINLIHSVVSS
jgi:hypothetical protein